MSDHQIHNERVRLVASAINNISVGVIAVGFAFLALSDRPLLWRGLVAVAAVGIGVVLHRGARAYLGRLRP